MKWKCLHCSDYLNEILKEIINLKIKDKKNLFYIITHSINYIPFFKQIFPVLLFYESYFVYIKRTSY